MRLLLDSHLLIWSAANSKKLSAPARRLIGDPSNSLHFSVASIWEIGIKASLGRKDFLVDAISLYRNSLKNGFRELPITAAHALAAASLPLLHKDPFDRLMVAQALAEGLTLLTVDDALSRYPGPIRVV